MTPLGPPTWPPARSLAQWWNDLAGRQPHRLWFCYWLIHRLEARIEVACSVSLDPLSLAVLRHLCQESTTPSSLETLHLDSDWLRQLLRELADLELVQEQAGWQPTPRGREAAGSGQVSHRCRRRRVFSFVDRSEEQKPPHYLPLALGKPAWLPGRGGVDSPPPMPPPAGGTLPVGCLEESVRQPEEWKQRFAFPTDVLAVLLPAGPDDWQGVVVDFPETLLLALIETGRDSSREWLGFRVQAGSWHLLGQEPILRLGPGWPEVFPELAHDPPVESWRQEWLRWCQSHSIPAAEIEAAVLQRQEHRLVVQAPKRMVERYRSGPRAEALRQEGWLLAGEGRCRAAAQIELVEVP